jgi:enoyl-CoA hydratase
VGADWSGSAHETVERVLAGFVSEPGPSPLRARLEAIDRSFAADRVEDIHRMLEKEGTPWAEETRATLQRMSPTSLKVTLRLLRTGRGRSYDAMVPVEYRLSQSMTARSDFREGIRAVLVDKDQKPRWSPATLAEVTDAEVDACFAPPPDGELTLPSSY